MFSPQPPSGDALVNPAARRRSRPSRPISRVLQRHERSGSGASIAGSVRDGSTASIRQDSESTTGASGDLSIIRKQSITLSGKEQDGGATDLTKNDRYRVSKLPGLPTIFASCIKNNTPVTAYTDSTHRYALLLSYSAAYVWEYAVSHTSPQTFSFPLPREESASLQNVQDPFPLGVLVSPSANSQEPGLVVVMPMTGRIAYWDAVGSAVSEGLFARRRGVEGKVPMMSSETVTSICSAEPAGFIISMSSGRLAHLALRDNAGRPGVLVTIMRGTSGLGGFLGALRAGSSRRDVVAVRAGKVLRMGEREVIVCTVRGNFSRWHVSRTGGYANIADVDLREQIFASFSANKTLHGKNKDYFGVLDLQVLRYRTSEVQGQEDSVNLLVLTAITPPKERAVYVLVSLEIKAGGMATVDNIHVIKSYATRYEPAAKTPRLYLPSPKKTAFVVLSRAVVVVSMERRENPYEGMEDDNQDWSSFEDVVDFRKDLGIEIVGSGSEGVDTDITASGEVMGSFTSDQGHIKKVKNPAVVLVAKGTGILRVEAFDMGHTKAVPTPVTVKSKLEQAVFYGTKSDNPLNFKGRDEISFPVEDLEIAALEISQEILCSRSPYLPTLLPSLGSHLELRAQYLRALITHLRTGAFGEVPKPVLWQLLQDAEKCEAARGVWDERNMRLREDPDAGEGVLGTIITEKFPEDSDIAGNDPIRTWFQREVIHIDKLLLDMKTDLAGMPNKGKRHRVAFAVSDSEANDIIIGALERAWAFRADSAKLYGIPDVNDSGLLLWSKGFVQPWTSGLNLLQALSDQYEMSIAAISAVWGPTEDPKQDDIVLKLASQLVHMAEICCRAFEEHADWCEQQGTENDAIVQEGILVRERYLEGRGKWIMPLVTYGMIAHGYKIAEYYQGYRTLVEICFEELVRVDVELAEAAAQDDETTTAQLKEEKNEVSERLENYFERFGESFATETYDYLVENGKLQTLLNGFEPWRKQYLTPFLRGNPKYAKLSWIHDVSLGDYDTASNTLFSVATVQEDILINQRIQLSIGKLSRLAALQNASASPLDTAEELETFDVKLELIKIQQRLSGVVKHITHSAIDIEAAVQLGTDEYARQLRKTQSLRDRFRGSFRELVAGKALSAEDLAELLTLMHVANDDGDSTPLLDGEAYYWALKAIGLAGLPRSRREFAEKTIWRRCFISDDWTQIVSTRNRTDEDVTALARQTNIYATLVLCHERGLFAHGSPFHPPRAPEDTLFSENPEEIRLRFPEADEPLIVALAHDLYEENRRLKRHLTKAKLQSWYQGLLAQAKEEAAARIAGKGRVDGEVEEDRDGDVTME